MHPLTKGERYKKRIQQGKKHVEKEGKYYLSEYREKLFYRLKKGRRRRTGCLPKAVTHVVNFNGGAALEEAQMRLCPLAHSQRVGAECLPSGVTQAPYCNLGMSVVEPFPAHSLTLSLRRHLGGSDCRVIVFVWTVSLWVSHPPGACWGRPGTGCVGTGIQGLACTSFISFVDIVLTLGSKWQDLVRRERKNPAALVSQTQCFEVQLRKLIRPLLWKSERGLRRAAPMASQKCSPNLYYCPTSGPRPNTPRKNIGDK